MDRTRHTLNELLVGMFNYILYLEERNLKQKGVKLSMNEVHILENIQKTSDNSMSHIAKRLMVTQGTLTTNVAKLVTKGYVERLRDPADKRVVRLNITEKAEEVLKVHEDFHREMIDKTIGDLGLDENEVLIQSLENILEYFRQVYGQEDNA